MKTCENCQFLWYFPGDITQPYPELACTKGHWDGVEDTDILLEETNCEDHKFKI